MQISLLQKGDLSWVHYGTLPVHCAKCYKRLAHSDPLAFMQKLLFMYKSHAEEHWNAIFNSQE